MVIHLDRIDELGRLRYLLGTAWITQEVVDECASGPRPVVALRKPVPSWIVVLPRSPKRHQGFGLGRGEASLLYEARRTDRLVLDDTQARAVAHARGLEVTGLLGLFAAAVETRRITVDRGATILAALSATDFRVSPALFAIMHRRIEQYKSK